MSSLPHEYSLEARPGGCLRGTLRPASDKSISHRGVLLGALANGRSRLRGLLQGEDVLATLAAVEAMGVGVRRSSEQVEIDGVGLRGLRQPPGPLDMGNSGTAMRLLAGVLAAQAFPSRLIGDASLSSRPMGRIIEPLREMGASIRGEGDRPPLDLQPVEGLRSIDYRSPVASAQVKSCLLLAGLCAGRSVSVSEPSLSRDHTERMLASAGVELERRENFVSLVPAPALAPLDLDVPADVSSAAFFLVGASIAGGSELTLREVGINPTRAGILEVLEAMGARIEVQDPRTVGGEPVAELRVRSAALQGIDVPAACVPRAIDEFPALFIAAACAEGVTRIRDAAELRVKESDRIAVMARALEQLGVEVTEYPDGIDIVGRGQSLKGGVVDACGDHRCAMALAMAALAAGEPLTIRNSRNVATSYPDFVTEAGRLGLDLGVSAHG